MAFYLVTASAKKELLSDLESKLEKREFESLSPFGYELNQCLTRARVVGANVAAWEEEDYCTPPLKQEKAAVLDRYFSNIKIENVKKGEGWVEIEHLSFLFPKLNKITT